MDEAYRRPMQQRLAVLREELASGEAQLRALDERRTQLQQTMLRISGAIQVLEELIQQDPSA